MKSCVFALYTSKSNYNLEQTKECVIGLKGAAAVFALEDRDIDL